jgi:hypothetical protein
MSQRDLTLNSGREIFIQELRQYVFYEGVLEGVPTPEINRQRLEELVAREQAKWGSVPFLVEPAERILPQKPGRSRVQALLPAIACVARFGSFEPARDRNADASELLVVWFQDDLAFPIVADVLESIQQVAWEQLARDFEY